MLDENRLTGFICVSFFYRNKNCSFSFADEIFSNYQLIYHLEIFHTSHNLIRRPWLFSSRIKKERLLLFERSNYNSYKLGSKERWRPSFRSRRYKLSVRIVLSNGRDIDSYALLHSTRHLHTWLHGAELPRGRPFPHLYVPVRGSIHWIISLSAVIKKGAIDRSRKILFYFNSRSRKRRIIVCGIFPYFEYFPRVKWRRKRCGYLSMRNFKFSGDYIILYRKYVKILDKKERLIV